MSETAMLSAALHILQGRLRDCALPLPMRDEEREALMCRVLRYGEKE